MTTPEQLAETVRAQFIAVTDPLDLWLCIDGNYTRPATRQETELLAALDSLLAALATFQGDYDALSDSRDEIADRAEAAEAAHGR